MLALDLVGSLEMISGRWQQIGTGVLFGLGLADRHYWEANRKRDDKEDAQ